MFLDFEKWHSCNNDFIIFQLSKQLEKQLLPSIKNTAAKICERNTGIGADGILIVEKEASQTPFLHIINSDGSVARTCGNGICCAASFLYQETQKKTREQLQGAEFQINGENYTSIQFFHKSNSNQNDLPYNKISMGTPCINEETALYEKVSRWVDRCIEIVGVKDQIETWNYVELLNKHIVIKAQMLEKKQLLCQELQRAPFWDGVNVSIIDESKITTKSKHISITIGESFDAYIWERGVGETKGCGSAACAIGCTSFNEEFISRDEWVEVRFPGGSIYTNQADKGNEISLINKANKTFSGSLEI